ncbi:MAG: flagellar hook-length control protein FliK [bacterium]
MHRLQQQASSSGSGAAEHAAEVESLPSSTEAADRLGTDRLPGAAQERSAGDGLLRDSRAAAAPGSEPVFHLPSPAPKGAMRAGEGRVTLKIEEESLGRMHWDLQVKDGKTVAAEAVVDTRRLQELIQGNQGILSDRLKAAGLEMQGLDVSVDQGSQRFASPADDRGQSERPPAPSCAAPPEALGGRAPQRAASRPARGNGLDLYV